MRHQLCDEWTRAGGEKGVRETWIRQFAQNLGTGTAYAPRSRLTHRWSSSNYRLEPLVACCERSCKHPATASAICRLLLYTCHVTEFPEYPAFCLLIHITNAFLEVFRKFARVCTRTGCAGGLDYQGLLKVPKGHDRDVMSSVRVPGGPFFFVGVVSNPMSARLPPRWLRGDSIVAECEATGCVCS